MGAAGTKERIIAQCQYRPADLKKAERKTREASGYTHTHKKRGDLVIVNPHVKSWKVTRNGWY